jgi:hypothetical protein
MTYYGNWHKWNHNLKHLPLISVLLTLFLASELFYHYFSDIVGGKGDDGESIYGSTFEGMYP